MPIIKITIEELADKNALVFPAMKNSDGEASKATITNTPSLNVYGAIDTAVSEMTRNAHTPQELTAQQDETLKSSWLFGLIISNLDIIRWVMRIPLHKKLKERDFSSWTKQHHWKIARNSAIPDYFQKMPTWRKERKIWEWRIVLALWKIKNSQKVLLTTGSLRGWAREETQRKKYSRGR